MLLGSPTSIADASVWTLGRGSHLSVSKYSLIVRLALVARMIGPIGKPISRAMTQASALPRLPVGTMNPGLRPVRA